MCIRDSCLPFGLATVSAKIDKNIIFISGGNSLTDEIRMEHMLLIFHLRTKLAFKSMHPNNQTCAGIVELVRY